jgi:hypothetical protein
MQDDESQREERCGCKGDTFAQTRALNDEHGRTVGGGLKFLVHQERTGPQALNTAAAILKPRQQRTVATIDGACACIVASGYDVSASAKESTLNEFEDERENELHESASIQ